MPPAPNTRTSREPFLRALPARSRWFFAAAVFLMFAPVMPLFVAQFARDGQSAVFVAWLALSGLGAVLWLASFTYSVRLLWLTVPYQITISTAFAFQASDVIGFAVGNVQWHNLLVVGLLVAGYVCFVFFVVGEGAKAFRMRVELGLAQRLHATLAPEIAQRVGGYEVRAVSLPSGEMGGDLVDLVSTPSGAIAVLADVSGHGVRAGVVMAMLKSALHASAPSDDLGRIVRAIDSTLHATTESSMFATGCALKLGEQGRCWVALAGHLPLYILREDGGIEEVENEALPLGVVANQDAVVTPFELRVGERAVVYTDGLTEAQNSDGQELGVSGALACLGSARETSLDGLIPALLERVSAHGPAADDRSVLVIQRVG